MEKEKKVERTTIMTHPLLMDRVAKKVKENQETLTDFYNRAILNQLEREDDWETRELLEQLDKEEY